MLTRVIVLLICNIAIWPTFDNSSKIEIAKYQEFSFVDFEKIIDQYKISSREADRLLGIALLNNFDFISPKYDIQISLSLDSIEFVGVFRNNKIYFDKEIGFRFRDDIGGEIKLQFNYYKKLNSLNYTLRENKVIYEKLAYSYEEINYQRHKGDTIDIKKIDLANDYRIEGSYLVNKDDFKKDTVITFDPFLYEEREQIKKLNKREMIGKWKWFDNENNMIKIENFDKK